MSRFAPSSTVALGTVAVRALAANDERLRARQPSWSRTELAFSPPGSIYHGYPYLFLPAFPRAPVDRVGDLALATRLLGDSLFVADAVMDGEYSGERLTHGTLQLQVLQLEAYALLYELFAPTARFWRHFRRWTAAYVEACHEERQLAAPGARWRLDSEAAQRMAAGKCGLAKIAVAGLAELSRGRGPSAAICRAIDCYYGARQMIDDLSDWRVDLERGFPSLLLARVVTASFGGDRAAMAADVRGTARAIYLDGHAEAVLQVGLRALDRSARGLAALPALPFHGLLRTLRSQYESVFAEVGAASLRLARKSAAAAVVPPAEEDAWGSVVCSALRLLLSRPGESASPSLLERCYRLEALAEADRWLAGSLRHVLDAECELLLARRLRSTPGGWRFTGAGPGLPPDLWHVAQALLALDRAGRPAPDGCLAATASRGGPAKGDPPTLWSLAGEWWRRPEHDAVDVVATATWLRLLGALAAPPPAGEGARRWLIAQQGEDGAWRSSGSSGPFLPTCAAVQALAASGPLETLGMARRFLARTQAPHGGWGGPGGEGDAWSTALGLLTLAVLEERSPSPEAGERAERARRWIEQSGGLESSTSRRPPQLLTASFLLRGAIRWSRALRRADATPATVEEMAVVA